MKVEQIHELLNSTVSEVLGREDVLERDLSNIVDVGNEILDTDKVDNYVKKLVNRIGKTLFKNRLYSGNVPSVFMDSWEFGSILQKVSADLPNAEENESWKLEDGQEYKQDIFYQPSVSAKFFNSKVTFEIPMSFTERQVKESFTSRSELNGFLTMLTTAINNAMTVKVNSLIMNTINNATAETLVNEGMGTDLSTETGVKAVNLADGFDNSEGLTLDSAFKSGDFIKHAIYKMSLYPDRLKTISSLFNIGGKERFTPPDELRTVVLSEFASAKDVFLSSGLINQELVTIPSFESVPYWQSSGQQYSLADTSSIKVKTSSGETVETSGIVAIMFDRESVGVSNTDERMTTSYNAKAEFYTNYYKYDASYFNDLNENYIVFYIAFDEGTTGGEE